MRLRSLRARLTLWYMSLLTVTVLVLGGGAYGLLVYSLTHETDAALHGVATTLAEQAQQQTTAFVPSDVDAIFQLRCGKVILAFGPCANVRQANAATALAQ